MAENSHGRRSKLLDHIDQYRADHSDAQAQYEVELHLHHHRSKATGEFVVVGGVWVYEKFKPTNAAEIEAAMKAGGTEDLKTTGPPVWTAKDTRRDNPQLFMRAWLDHIQRYQAVGVCARFVVKDLKVDFKWDRAKCATLGVVHDEAAELIKTIYKLFKEGHVWDRKERVLRRNAGRHQFTTPATVSTKKG